MPLAILHGVAITTGEAPLKRQQPAVLVTNQTVAAITEWEGAHDEISTDLRSTAHTLARTPSRPQGRHREVGITGC